MLNRNKYLSLIKDTLIFAIGSIGSKVILFFLVPFYTAYLSTEEYGISNLVFTISQFLIPIMSLEVFDAVLRFGLSISYCKEDVLKNALCIIVLDFVLCFFLFPILGLYRPVRDWRVYLLIYFLVSIINTTVMNYLKVCEKNKAYAGISLLQTFVLCISNIILIAQLKIGVRGYLISNILALFVSSFAAFLYGKVWQVIQDGKLNKHLLKEMLAYSSPLILNSVSWWLISSSDKIMIEGMVNTSELGIYTVAAKIPALINVIIAIFQQAWGISSIKEIETTNDKKFFSNTFRFYSIIVYTACILALCFIRSFMSIYIRGGDEYQVASNYVPFLLVSAFFSALSTFYGSLYTALKMTNKIMITTLIAGTANVIVNYFAIKYLGTMGAVIGTVVAYLLTTVIRMVDMRKYIKLDINYSKTILNWLLLFLFALAVTNSQRDNVTTSVLFLTSYFVLNFHEINLAYKKIKK